MLAEGHALVDPALAVFGGQDLAGPVAELFAPLMGVAAGLGMVDVGVVGQGQLPTRVPGPQTVVVLLAVARGEGLLVEEADLVHHLPAHHQAESVQEGHGRMDAP